MNSSKGDLCKYIKKSNKRLIIGNDFDINFKKGFDNFIQKLKIKFNYLYDTVLNCFIILKLLIIQLLFLTYNNIVLI